jgi:hypothetical protein
LKRLNYRVAELGKDEPRPRQIRVLIDKLEDVGKVAPLLADIFNEEPAGKRFAVYGAAWDDMIDELKARGYAIEPLPDPKE